MNVDRRRVLAAFIRNQAGLVQLKGGKVVEGVGDVHLSNAEALMAAEALDTAATVGETVDDVIRRHVLATLAAYDGHKPTAAGVLGVSLKTLYNYLHKWRAT